MKISIITVSYNSAATIADTLRSVAAQDYSDIEHIVIDGGSADGTLGLVEEHGKHVSVLVSEPDRGIYDAMNKGIAIASGSYVGFLNADDMFASEQVVSRIAAAAATGADAVFGDLVYVGQHQTERVIRHWRSGPFRAGRLRFGWMPPHPTFYMKRSVLQKIGGFDTTLRVAADYDMMMRCLTRKDASASYVPEVLVRMRTGGLSNGSAASIAQKSREDLQVMRRHHIGGWPTLVAKNLRKLTQFVSKAP